MFILSIVPSFQELLSCQYYSTFAYAFLLLFPKVALEISNYFLSGNVVFFFTDVSPWIPKPESCNNGIDQKIEPFQESKEKDLLPSSLLLLFEEVSTFWVV